MKPDVLASMKALTAMQRDVALSELSALQSHIEKLKRRAAQLSEDATSQAQKISRSGFGTALEAHQFQRWQCWLHEQRAELNAELAKAYVSREDALADARIAFGRDSAVKELERRARHHARQAKQKHLEASAQNKAQD